MRFPGVFILAAFAAFSLTADDAQRIDRVEKGLRGPVAIKGQPLATMTIADRLKFYHVPGVSIAMIDEGKVVWARGYGVTSADGAGKPVTPHTLFQAASISKHVAAMVALHLVDEGKLALDENVNDKLRSWKVPENEFTKTEKVTLRRLLNHSAGMTVHGFPGYEAGSPVPTLVEVLDGKPPANTPPIRVDVTPGTIWRYSGGGYEVMQQLVIDVAGQPFPKLAREFVLDPLGMKESTYDQPLPSAWTDRAATAHDAQGQPIKGKYHTYPEMAAAGLWTTPSDLAKVVLELQTGGHVLKPATQREMLTKILGDYGLGLSLAETDGQKSFSHGGSNAGFQCMMFAYLAGGRGAVVMTNGDRGGPLASEILRSISAEYHWPDYKQQEKTIAQVSDETLRRYAGIYHLSNGPTATFSAEKAHLSVTLPQGQVLEMLPESDTSFFSPTGEFPAIHFTQTRDGAVEFKINGFTARKQ